MTLPVAPKLIAAAAALLAVGVFAGVQIGKSDRQPAKYPAPNPTVTQRLAEPQYEEEAQPFDEETGTEEDDHQHDEDPGYEDLPEDDGSYYDDGGIDYTQPAPRRGSSVQCPDCGNSGYRMCYSCDGTGMIDNSGARAIAGLGQAGPPDETCSTCGGTGQQRCMLH
jgi:hypothetical protein